MNGNKFRCLLVGLGKRAINDHLPALVPNTLGIELVAVCDADENKKELLEKIFSEKKIIAPNFYTNLSEACRREKPDFAIITTPHSTHFEIAQELLEYDIPFLKEKPFAISLAEAHKLKKLIEEKNGYMMTCVQRRYHPLYVYGKKLLDYLQDVRHFEAHYQLHADAYYYGWRSTPKESGGGCVMDMGYHYIDLLYWYFGKPEQIFSVSAPKNHIDLPYSVEETTLTSFKYDNGTVGHLFLSLCEATKSEELSAFGKYGYIQLQREFLKRFDADNNLVESLTRAPAWPSAVSDVLIDFLKNFRNSKVVERECSNGIEVMEIIDGIYRSIQEKKAVFLTNKSNKNLAVNGGPRIFEIDIKYNWPLINQEAEQAVIKQLHTALSIYDKSGAIGEFEDKFAAFHEMKYGLVTSSGTSALHSAYYAIGLGPGDEVICPDYTFFATAVPLFQLGALPVLADCDETGGLKPSEIERLITEKTKAVVVTHMWGQPCEMSEILSLCQKHNLRLIEDCSHAHGARYNNKYVGTFGDIGIWSLQTQKIIAAGEGGILLTNSRQLYDRAQLLGHFNKRALKEMDSSSPDYQYATTGTGLKYRAHPLGIAFALTQLPNLKKWIEAKQSNAARLKEILASCPGIKFLSSPQKDFLNAYYALIFTLDEKVCGFNREELVSAINAEGFLDLDIPKSTSPLHTFAIFQKPISPVTAYNQPCIRGSYPNSDFIAKRAVKISVPVEVEAGSRGDEFIKNFKLVWDKVTKSLR